MGRGRTIRFGKPDSGHAGTISITARVRRAQWNAMKPGIQYVLTQWPRPGVRDEAVTIAGQLCTPKDLLARRVRVSRPRALRVGDMVAFGLAGAYAWNISHHGFGMHPPPAFHYLA